MKKYLQVILIGLVALFLLSACSQQAETEEEQTEEETIILEPGEQELPALEEEEEESKETTEETMMDSSSEETTVEMTSEGFSPSTLTITQGTTVTFTNTDTSSHRPASNPHPTHTGYPEEGTCSGSSFDSCDPIATGESWSFTFNEEGTWNYHDHMSPGLTGTIIVE